VKQTSGPDLGLTGSSVLCAVSIVTARSNNRRRWEVAGCAAFFAQSGLAKICEMGESAPLLASLEKCTDPRETPISMSSARSGVRAPVKSPIMCPIRNILAKYHARLMVAIVCRWCSAGLKNRYTGTTGTPRAAFFHGTSLDGCFTVF